MNRPIPPSRLHCSVSHSLRQMRFTLKKKLFFKSRIPSGNGLLDVAVYFNVDESVQLNRKISLGEFTGWSGGDSFKITSYQCLQEAGS